MKIAIFAFAIGQATAMAQNYSIDWFTISGGGASSGGAYSVSGAIGQPAAGGPLVNGQFSLLSGYWTFLIAVQTPDAPFLSIGREASGAVTISWPRPAAGWVLEQTGAFATAPLATTWSPIAPPYAISATDVSVTVPSPAGTAFFRLHKQ
jgi:hypothetical protein